jgi:predicted RNA-binding protein with TRAM domain
MKEERLQRLTHFVEDARTELEELDEKRRNIESALRDVEDIVEAEESHHEAGKKDARDQLATGDTHELVIEDPPGKEGPAAVARIDGIVTFVSPQKLDIKAGDTVQAKLTDVSENHANAVATAVLD